MYVVGITEIQFIAYIQLVSQRFQLLNKILVDIRQMVNLYENRCLNDFTTMDNINASPKYHTFEYFRIKTKLNAISDIIFQKPKINCIRYGSWFVSDWY